MVPLSSLIAREKASVLKEMKKSPSGVGMPSLSTILISPVLHDLVGDQLAEYRP